MASRKPDRGREKSEKSQWIYLDPSELPERTALEKELATRVREEVARSRPLLERVYEELSRTEPGAELWQRMRDLVLAPVRSWLPMDRTGARKHRDWLDFAKADAARLSRIAPSTAQMVSTRYLATRVVEHFRLPKADYERVRKCLRDHRAEWFPGQARRA